MSPQKIGTEKKFVTFQKSFYPQCTQEHYLRKFYLIYAAICRRAFPHFYTFVIFLPYSILLEELNTDVLIYRMNSLEPIETTRYFFSLLVLQWAEIQKKVLVQLFVEASLFASIFLYIFKKKVFQR